MYPSCVSVNTVRKSSTTRSELEVCMLQSPAVTRGPRFISCAQSTDWLVQPRRTRLGRSVPVYRPVLRVQQGTTSCTRSKRVQRSSAKSHVIRSAAQKLSPMNGEHAVGESVVVAGLRLTDHSFKVMYCLRYATVHAGSSRHSATAHHHNHCRCTSWQRLTGTSTTWRQQQSTYNCVCERGCSPQ